MLKEYFRASGLFLMMELASLNCWLRGKRARWKGEYAARTFVLRRRLAVWRRQWENERDRYWFECTLGGNEFDPSLRMDPDKMAKMNRAELDEYERQMAEWRDKADKLDSEQNMNKP